MAEGTRSTALKAHQESNQRQPEAIQRQFDDQQQTIHAITDVLDEMSDMIRTLIETSLVNPPSEVIQELSVVITDNRSFLYQRGMFGVSSY